MPARSFENLQIIEETRGGVKFSANGEVRTQEGISFIKLQAAYELGCLDCPVPMRERGDPDGNGLLLEVLPASSMAGSPAGSDLIIFVECKARLDRSHLALCL
jgi:hypothetical protein